MIPIGSKRNKKIYVICIVQRNVKSGHVRSSYDNKSCMNALHLAPGPSTSSCGVHEWHAWVSCDICLIGHLVRKIQWCHLFLQLTQVEVVNRRKSGQSQAKAGSINPRRAGGGTCLDAPPSQGFLHTFLYVLFAPSLKISAQDHLRSGHQVRSSGPTSMKSLQLRRGYSFQGISLKLSGIDKTIITYKMYISEFWSWWPKARSIFWPDHHKAMGKCSYAVFFGKYEWECAIYLRAFLH